MAHLHKGGNENQWSELWSTLDNTVKSKDVYYVMDELKKEYLLKLLPTNGGATLEVGCGSARMSAFLAQKNFSIFGLDLSSQALALAQNNFSFLNIKGNFLLADGEKLPFEDATFDIVLSTGLLEHFEDPSGVMSEMTRVLKPNGLFWSDVVPRKFSLLRAFDGLRFNALRKKEIMYERSFSKAEVIHLLKTSGLQNTHIFFCGVFPPLWFPLLFQLRIYRRFHSEVVTRLKPVWAALDNTRIAEFIGFYFVCYGIKS